MKLEELIHKLEEVSWPHEQGRVVVAVIQKRAHDGHGCRMTAKETQVCGIAIHVEDAEGDPNILLECALVEGNDRKSPYNPADLYKACLRVGKKYRDWTVDVGVKLLPAGGGHKVGIRTDHRVVMCGCRDRDKTIAFLIDCPPRDWFDRLLLGGDIWNVVEVDVGSIRKAAEAGDAAAQNELGLRYAHGIELKKNDRLAVLWYRKAAEQGNVCAQFNLGRRYEDGLGVSQNIDQAVEWYRKAARRGSAPARNNLGWIYLTGKGGRKNYARAVVLIRKAAEQGFAYAQSNLGWMLGDGVGVRRNEGESVKWYSKAAEQGDAAAQYNLGVCYAAGTGVPQDSTQAAKWLQASAAQGFSKAQERLAAISVVRSAGGKSAKKAEDVRKK